MSTRIHEALAGLVGLFDLLESRAKSHPTDMLGLVWADLRDNHRLIEAREALDAAGPLVIHPDPASEAICESCGHSLAEHIVKQTHVLCPKT